MQAFYGHALGLAFESMIPVGSGMRQYRYLASARRVSAPPFANPLEVIKAMAALGIRYVTVQVRNCDEAFKALTSGGALEAVAPTNFGAVARICFVRDPDGNFAEISQRPPS